MMLLAVGAQGPKSSISMLELLQSFTLEHRDLVFYTLIGALIVLQIWLLANAFSMVYKGILDLRAWRRGTHIPTPFGVAKKEPQK